MTRVLRKMKAWLFAEDEEGLDSAPYEEEGAEPTPRRRHRLISIRSRPGEIFIRRPRNREDSRVCVDCLRSGKAVVVNLKDLQTEHAVRIFDFLGGATYALNGQLEQAGDSVYLLTPHNIGIAAEDEAEVPVRASAWQEI
jgi:cell division inhibitor SepF